MITNHITEVQLEEQTTKLGESVALTCLATGVSRPDSVYWSMDGAIIMVDQNPDHNQMEMWTRSYLEIGSVQQEHVGDYRCVVRWENCLATLPSNPS